MRFPYLLTLAGWLTAAALLPAQAINPGTAVELPTYTVPERDASTDECGDEGVKRSPTFYFSADSLWWYTKPNKVDRQLVGSLRNPLSSFTATQTTGGLNDPNAVVLYGNEEVDYELQWGLRGSLQVTFDDMQSKGLEFAGLYLPRQSETTTFQSNGAGQPPLSLLHWNVANGRPPLADAFPIAGVNGGTLLAGGVSLDTYTEFWGGECNLFQRFAPRGSIFFGEVLLGYRHQGLYEGFTIHANSNAGVFVDEFTTRNMFHGAQVGGRFGVQVWQLSFQAVAKFAAGANDQELWINGHPGTNSFYARQTNGGLNAVTRFGYICDGTASVTWAFAPNWACSCGYSVLYWNRVFRPTNQVDPNINFNQVGGQTSPFAPIKRNDETDFWATGITCSLELMF